MDSRTVLSFSRRLLWRRTLLVPLAAALAACSALGRSETKQAASPTQGAAASQRSEAPSSATQTTTQSSDSTPPAAATALPATPACEDDDDPTPPQTAGPFYTPNTPLRTSLLESGFAGTRLLLSGQVLSTRCAPIAGALLDFWHTNDVGEYDNEGYTFRGHQFADDQGRFTLETIVPGIYPGRTRHIHVRVQAPNQPILTTQLYFPGESGNQGDGIFDPALLVELTDAAEGKQAQFTFVLDVP
ncbi:MAG: dioxygenase [Chloroflexota bacterium]|nr:dioxygenase [Chloroflexota bacterium]MDE2841435.1 dioxygenase [Chloroflexota bacterium]